MQIPHVLSFSCLTSGTRSMPWVHQYPCAGMKQLSQTLQGGDFQEEDKTGPRKSALLQHEFLGAEPRRALGNPGARLQALQWVCSQQHGRLIPLHSQLTQIQVFPEVYNSITTASSCLQKLNATGIYPLAAQGSCSSPRCFRQLTHWA